MPKRIQLRRTKGWRKPEGAIVVARPTKFGNPWTIQYKFGHWHVYQGPRLCWTAVTLNTRAAAHIVAVGYYCSWLKHNRVPGHSALKIKALSALRNAILDAIPDLAGHDLACWCPLDQPCHADVLLEIANQARTA